MTLIKYGQYQLNLASRLILSPSAIPRIPVSAVCDSHVQTSNDDSVSAAQSAASQLRSVQAASMSTIRYNEVSRLKISKDTQCNFAVLDMLAKKTRTIGTQTASDGQ